MRPDEITQTDFNSLTANLQASQLRVDRDQWSSAAQELRRSGAELLTLWGADDRDRNGCFHVYAAYLSADGVVVVKHPVDSEILTYPDIGTLFPAARRMQRATYDLLGIAADATDRRGWLRHGGWPETVFPLRR